MTRVINLCPLPYSEGTIVRSLSSVATVPLSIGTAMRTEGRQVVWTQNAITVHILLNGHELTYTVPIKHLKVHP